MTIKEKRFGAFITRGAQDWQIFQRRDGFARVTLGGVWEPSDGMVNGIGEVYARAVREDDGSEAVRWRKAVMLPGKSWECALELPQGGLYRIETGLMENGAPFCPFPVGRRGDTRVHIGVGDLFVIAGQSNAVGYGRGVAEDPPELGVHILKNSEQWSLAVHPLGDSTDSVTPENYAAQNVGTSPFLTFGREVKRRTGLPVGLLQTAYDGQNIRKWKPDGSGELYDLMCRRVRQAGGDVSAVLWYQGCSDAIEDIAQEYEAAFREFVEAFRTETGLTALPFLTVQLNRHKDSGGGHMDDTWATVREAQRRLAHTMEQVSVVPSQDLELSQGDGLHTSSAGNVILGRRLAGLWWENQSLTVPTLAPEAVEAHWRNGSVEVLFANLRGSLVLPRVPGDRPFFTLRSGVETIPCTVRVTPDNTVELRPAESGTLPLVVSGGREANPCMHPPRDDRTGLPVLAFDGLRIT